jgi:hypothetical protein
MNNVTHRKKTKACFQFSVRTLLKNSVGLANCFASFPIIPSIHLSQSNLSERTHIIFDDVAHIRRTSQNDLKLEL